MLTRKPTVNLLPIQIAARPSQREALAAANGRSLRMERANKIAKLLLLAVCVVAVLVMAVRG